jgi:hypothetical protein
MAVQLFNNGESMESVRNKINSNFTELDKRRTYTHSQTTPAAVWLCQHNLGGTPVTALCVDDTGEQIVGAVNTLASTVNLLVIEFSEPLRGTAYMKF